MHKLMETRMIKKVTDSFKFPWKPFCSLQISRATKIIKIIIRTGTPYSKLKYINLWTWLARYKNAKIAR